MFAIEDARFAPSVDFPGIGCRVRPGSEKKGRRIRPGVVDCAAVGSQLTTHTTLLARLRDVQDHGAWAEFHGRYEGLIRTYARRQGLQAADCDDCVQDVLIGLSKAMPGFEYDPRRGKFRSFLKTIATRAIFRRFRQKAATAGQQPVKGDDPPIDDDRNEQIWEQEWRSHHLRLAMRTLEAEFNTCDRAAFEAYAVDGRDARETAEALGMTVEQVYQAKSRILKRLSEVIQQNVAEEG
jgi:RNA polymerase sigma-70 factor (ECF subfamily)